jgi:hypothetical protein
MLVMKSWLEIRWRILMVLAFNVLEVSIPYNANGGFRAAPPDPGRAAGAMMLVVSFLWLFAASVLAGAGIRSQSPLQAKKGLHGSTYFTLSLPVSRFRLLAVRAGLGLLGVLSIVVISGVLFWNFFPLIRTNSMPSDFFKWVFTGSCWVSGVYALSVLLATTLDEIGQMFGTLIAILVLRLATLRFPLPSSFDIFNIVGGASPLVTHTLPWPIISVSLGLTLLLFLIAGKVVQTLEY